MSFRSLSVLSRRRSLRCLLLSLILLQSERELCGLKPFRFTEATLSPHVWFILVSVLCALEKNTSLLLLARVLCECQVDTESSCSSGVLCSDTFCLNIVSVTGRLW